MSTGKRLSRVVGVAGVPPGDLADLFTATAGRQFAVLAEYDRGSNAEQIQVLSIARVRTVAPLSAQVVCPPECVYSSGNVSQAISNPSYNMQTFTNDLTLLRLAAAAQFTARVSPVCLATASNSAPPPPQGNGPLVCQSRSSRVWFQVGIVSWGTSNCNVRAPVVYACVSFLCPWIDQVVASN
ncbi:chymotrypsin-like protease CTRL-1 [Arapaima gigas]